MGLNNLYLKAYTLILGYVIVNFGLIKLNFLRKFRAVVKTDNKQLKHNICIGVEYV